MTKLVLNPQLLWAELCQQPSYLQNIWKRPQIPRLWSQTFASTKYFSVYVCTKVVFNFKIYQMGPVSCSANAKNCLIVITSVCFDEKSILWLIDLKILSVEQKWVQPKNYGLAKDEFSQV